MFKKIYILSVVVICQYLSLSVLYAQPDTTTESPFKITSSNFLNKDVREKSYQEYIRSLNLSDKELLANIEELVLYDNYKHALLYLEILHETDSNNLKIPFLVGRCYLHLGAGYEREAAKYFGRYLVTADKIDIDVYFYLGQAYHVNYQFDPAIKAYEQYLAKAKKTERYTTMARQNINMCINGKEIYNNPREDVTISNIGEPINSIYSEYVPVISADESILIFTSRRASSTGGLQDIRGAKDDITGDYYEDIYYSTKLESGQWAEPVGIGSNINTAGHDASVGLSPDGTELFIYKSDGYQYGDLFSCKLEGDHWASPEKLPYPINSKYWEGSASLSGDAQMLFFSSNRPGGYGGKDIYIIRKFPNGEWAQPMNLGPEINTPYDDDAPFIHPDGKTLYFSSLGHKSMGGYDIFVSTCMDERFREWKTPENLGYPINTTDNDLYFVLSGNGERGYYASSKQGGLGETDIYVINMPETDENAPKPLTLVKGRITSADSSSVPDGAAIRVLDKNTKELIGIYKVNSSTGKYIIIVPIGANYDIITEAPGYEANIQNINFLDQTEYIELNRDISLSPKVE